MEKSFYVQVKKVRRENEWLEKVYDYALVCNSLQRQISPMEVVEDFESRPQTAVSFVVENDAWLQWRRVAREMHKPRRQGRRAG